MFLHINVTIARACFHMSECVQGKEDHFFKYSMKRDFTRCSSLVFVLQKLRKVIVFHSILKKNKLFAEDTAGSLYKIEDHQHLENRPQ